MPPIQGVDGSRRQAEIGAPDIVRSEQLDCPGSTPASRSPGDRLVPVSQPGGSGGSGGSPSTNRAAAYRRLGGPRRPEDPRLEATCRPNPSNRPTGQSGAPVQELLPRAQPLPPHEDMVIDDLTEDEGAAFLAALEGERAGLPGPGRHRYRRHGAASPRLIDQLRT